MPSAKLKAFLSTLVDSRRLLARRFVEKKKTSADRRWESTNNVESKAFDGLLLAEDKGGGNGT